METVYTFENDSKPCFDIDNTICRCCFSTDKKLYNIVPLTSLFSDLMNIEVTDDSMPPWLCYECCALLIKSVRFKQQVHKAQSLWYEYINRCAPFPPHAQDSELQKYRLPLLTETPTLLVTAATGGDNCNYEVQPCQVFQHKKAVLKSELLVDLPLIQEDDRKSLFEEDIKAENAFSDYEDNLTLEAYKSITAATDDLTTLLGAAEPDIKLEPDTKRKRKTKKTEPRQQRKAKKDELEEFGEIEDFGTKSVRRSIEVDESKVEIITLNPEDHMRQLKEEFEGATLKFPFQCTLCYKGFNFQVKLDNHMRKHSPSRGRFTCTHCEMHFPSKFSQQVHMYTHTRRYKCKQCDKIMRDPATIMQHVRTQHEGITDLFTCEICGKISTNSKTHRGHMRNHHGGARPACDVCARSFVNVTSLQEHMQIHEGVKNFSCPECGKRFRTRTQVKYHQLTHTDLRLYYCVECDVRFKSAQSLKQHLQKSLRHVDKNPAAPPALLAPEAARVQCGLCLRWLSSARALRRHARRHQPPPPPRHACAHCHKMFTSKSVLINHIRTHTGEKPFACNTCGRRFSQRTAMLTHCRLLHKAAAHRAD